jgi:hypothetical protein
MIVTIPFVSHAYPYLALAEKFRAYGPYPSHALHVICQASESEAATGFFDSLKEMFQSAGLFFITEDGKSGADLATSIFRCAAESAFRHEPVSGEVVNCPWMFYDPGQAPASKDWADNVQVEWFKRGKRVIGNTTPYPNQTVVANGQKFEIDGGVRFNGSVVLPKDFYDRSALLKNPSAGVHWRDRLRYELAESHAKSETLAKGTTLFKTHRKPRIPDPPAPKANE